MRDAFREHRAETDSRRIQELMQRGLKELQMLKVDILPGFWEAVGILGIKGTVSAGHNPSGGSNELATVDIY
jgi:hypothetical protein